MTTEDSKIQAIFREALGKEPGPQRDAFLESACDGDTSLFKRVGELLREHDRPSTSREVDGHSLGATSDLTDKDQHLPTIGWESRDSPSDKTMPSGETAEGDAEPGTRISYLGDYEIRNVLGRGGMGIVYRARQISLNRIVALKMIKAGVLASADELRRFRNEADAIALLDHPGIVPVYEVGEHEGLQYFSMKLIEGGSLAEKLPDYREAPRAAAKLVAETAEAISHAHVRGILHRDLKPANLIIDRDGKPHVTDFGLARRIETDGELTETGQILGTPAYMPPEQASGRRGSITTATDVYAVGAVLYALLTGQAPFGGDSAIETLDAVRNRPPAPPRKLNAATPRDLETITLKCLEKDPRRRYSSAQALGDDLRAWLDNRPIGARRIGVFERTWLWCKRRPAVAALAVATALALVVGTASVIAVQARANRDLQAEYEATQQAELLADRRLDGAMAAIRDYYTGVAEEVIRGEQIPMRLRERLLARPQVFYEDLTEELASTPNPAPRELLLLAEGRAGLGNIFLQLGRHQEASQQCDLAIELFDRLGEAESHVPEHEAGLANTYAMRGDILSATGNADASRQAHEKAIEIGETLVAANPQVSRFRKHLANAYSDIGNIRRTNGEIDAAIEAHKQAVSQFELLVVAEPEVKEHQSGLAASFSNLGLVLSATPESTAAIEAFQQAIKIGEGLVKDSPEESAYQDGLASSLTNLGLLQQSTGKIAEAKNAHARALEIYKALVSMEPGVPEYQDGLAGSYVNLGLALDTLGEAQAAVEAQQNAIQRYESLVAIRPGVPEYQDALSTGYLNLGSAYESMSLASQASVAYSKAIEFKQELVDAHPEVPVYRYGLAASYSNLANIQKEAGDLADARDAYTKAITMLDELLILQPNVPDYRYAKSVFHINLGYLQQDMGNHAESLSEFRLSEEYSIEGTAVAEELPDMIREAASLVSADERLPNILAGRNTPLDAEEHLLFARLCYTTSRYAAATRFWEQAFEENATLLQNAQEQYRFQAACAAAMAGCGNGVDDPALDSTQQAEYRAKAIAWLTEELAARMVLVQSVSPDEQAAIIESVGDWSSEPELAGVREPFAQLTDAEATAWRSFWEKVAQAAP